LRNFASTARCTQAKRIRITEEAAQRPGYPDRAGLTSSGLIGCEGWVDLHPHLMGIRLLMFLINVFSCMIFGWQLAAHLRGQDTLARPGVRARPATAFVPIG
jgi:hypothetical protein